MDFYYLDESAPCRAAMLTARAVGVRLNKKVINLFAGEHMQPDFIAINPQHCIPTIKDGDLTLWESRAICTYLINKYGKDDSLYPKDPKSRAKVDRLLYFDMGTLFSRFRDYLFPVIMKGESPDPEKVPKIQEALGWLNDCLEGHTYAFGNNITVADHCLVATVSTIAAAGICISGHNNVYAWLEMCKNNMPGYETENGRGAEAFGKMAKSKMAGK